MTKEQLIKNLTGIGFIQVKDYSDSSVYQKHTGDDGEDFIELTIVDAEGYYMEYYRNVGWCSYDYYQLTDIIPFT